jgi:hypothetical protein
MMGADRYAELESVLRLVVSPVTTVTDRTWRLGKAGATGGALIARADESWLLLETDGCHDHHNGHAPDPWELLRRNDRAGAGAKHVLDLEGRPRLRGELALADLGDDDLLADRLQSLHAELVGAADEGSDGAVESPERVGDAGEPPLRDVIEEAGWPPQQQPDDRLLVELDGRRCRRTASLHRDHRGAVTAAVDLIQAENASPGPRRLAVAQFLLAGTGLIRLVCAARVHRHDEDILLLQVRLAAPVTAPALSEALSALCVACGLLAPEADLLAEDAALAGAWLDRWPQPPSDAPADITASPTATPSLFVDPVAST